MFDLGLKRWYSLIMSNSIVGDYLLAITPFGGEREMYRQLILDVQETCDGYVYLLKDGEEVRFYECDAEERALHDVSRADRPNYHLFQPQSNGSVYYGEDDIIPMHLR